MTRLKYLSILFLLAILISACERISIPPLSTAGPTETEQPDPTETLTPTPEITPTPVDLIGVDKSSLAGVEIELWHAWGSPQTEILEAQIADFNRRNPWHITVSARPFADWAELAATVDQAAESHELPELVVTLPEYALEWNAQGLVVDLMNYVEHPGWGLTENEIADIPRVFWEQDQVGDKRLGIPAERSTRLLFYNSRWGRELGFESAPENDVEFRDQVCAANGQFRSDSAMSNDGFGGWIVNSDPQTALSWLQAFGGGAVNENKYDFQSVQNTEALTFLKELFDSSCAWIYTGSEPYAPLAERTALFVSGDLSELADQGNAFSTARNSDEWDVIPFPGSAGRSILAYGPSFTVLKNTPEKQLAAWLFARWMLKPEIQAQWVRATGMFPLRKSSIEDLENYASSHPQWAQAVALLGKAAVEPQKASWRTVKYVLGDGFYSIFRLNLPPSEIPTVLEQMQATADDLDH